VKAANIAPAVRCAPASARHLCAAGRPHDDPTTVKRVHVGADSMNPDFLLVRWSDLAVAGEPKLQVRLR
jgi:hypothetical protein